MFLNIADRKLVYDVMKKSLGDFRNFMNGHRLFDGTNCVNSKEQIMNNLKV